MDWDLAMKAGATDPAECVEVKATDPLYVLYTSGTTGKPKGIVRDNGGHAVAMAWSLPNIYDVHAGQVWWTASDVGWVVGHSYIVYAPLINGATTVLYEGKPVGTPDAGAFWRVIAEHGVEALFTAPTAIRAIKKEDAGGTLLAGHDLSAFRTLFLAGERLDPDTYQWATEMLGVPVVDNWWQTETGWPIAANLRGLDPMPIKPGSPTVPVPGYQVEVIGERGTPGRRRRGGRDLPPAAAAPGHADHAVGRRRAVRVVVPVRLRGLLPLRRRRVRRRGRLPVRDGPHRRRHQRRRSPALDRVDGGRHRHPSRGRGVRGDRRRGPVEGTGPARLRGAQERRRAGPGRGRSASSWPWSATRSARSRPSRTSRSSAACRRPAAGKILRKTMREIADGKEARVPSTIEDVEVLDRLRSSLRTD